jgi:hypothetical protein
VYKARERGTGRIVALKKVRFDTSESESVRFMAREIRFLQRLDHPNVMKLEGIATSRMHRSIYLVFDFMYSDLGRLVLRSGQRLTEPQVSSSSFPFFFLIRRPCTTTTTTDTWPWRPSSSELTHHSSWIRRLFLAVASGRLSFPFWTHPSIHLTGRQWPPCVSEDRTLGYSTVWK